MSDGPGRAALKRIVCVIVGAEVRLRRVMRTRRGYERYVLAGAYRRSGICCESPAVQEAWLTWAEKMGTFTFSRGWHP